MGELKRVAERYERLVDSQKVLIESQQEYINLLNEKLDETRQAAVEVFGTLKRELVAFGKRSSKE
jgi:hypothetical protein